MRLRRAARLHHRAPGLADGPDNALRVKIDLIKLLRAQPGGFAFQTPDFDFNNFELPSLFALLSDPSVIVDGLDRLLLDLQDALSGQIFGQQAAVRRRPAEGQPGGERASLDFRTKLLQPLATVLRENNATLATLVGLIQQKVVNVLGPAGPIATALGLAGGTDRRTAPARAAGIDIDDILTSGVDPANPFDTTPLPAVRLRPRLALHRSRRRRSSSTSASPCWA